MIKIYCGDRNDRIPYWECKIPDHDEECAIVTAIEQEAMRPHNSRHTWAIKKAALVQIKQNMFIFPFLVFEL